MSSKVCPKTCSQLSTAAVFISVGVVQLLAGIILLKSEPVFLLAGIDFIAAASNILVGSSLGISASVWENKKKQITTKSTARQNVLAGLYISVMVVNTTTAVVMIMGDGNKLLTVADEASRNTSALFVLEILACAYVTSVCSPIVCIVVALVCLSGNKIQIRENMKERECISKTDSYGWVFKDNHEKGPKLSDVISPYNKNSSVSDDNVFLDKKSYPDKRSFMGKKLVKNSTSRYTVSSARELQSPLEIWAHKRNKILQEITSQNKSFLPDDYLQFPDFSYGSYVETLPRIKQTSLLDPRNRMNAQRTQVATLECSKDKIAKGDEITRVVLQLQSHEMKAKAITKPSSYSDSKSLTEINLSEIYPLKESTRETHESLSSITSRPSIDTPDSVKSKHFPAQLKTQWNGNQSSGESLKQQILPEHYAEDSKSAQSFLESCNRSDAISKNKITKQKQTFADVFIDDIRDTENKEVSGVEHSTVSDFKAETINELKSKFDKICHDARSAFEEGKEFMRSFKNGSGRKLKWSDSDLEDKPSFLGNSTERTVFSESSETDPTLTRTSWAGEVVPISLRTVTVNRTNSIPVSTVGSRTSNYHSTSIEDTSLDEILDGNTGEENVSQISGRVRSHKRSTSLYTRNNDKEAKKFVFEYPKMSSIKKSEKKRNIFDRISSMGSIAESPTEEIIHNEKCSNSLTLERELPVVSADVDNIQCFETNTDGTPPSISPKHCGLKATPSTNILKRLWSFAGTEDKADISNLIMDVDSLVGLSEEELMARTHRIRQLRKSVIMRSRNENEESE